MVPVNSGLEMQDNHMFHQGYVCMILALTAHRKLLSTSQVHGMVGVRHS